MIREALSAVARNESIGPLLSRTPVARDVVKRVIGGESVDDALAVAHELADRGFTVSLERAAPHVESEEQADAVAQEYLRLVGDIAASGLAGVCEIVVFPESLHVSDRPDAAWSRLQTLVRAGNERGVCVMVGAGSDPEHTVSMVEELAAENLTAGATIAAAHRRAGADCRRLSAGRVRLVKGGRRGDASDLQQPIEIDKAFIRCAKELLRGTGQPSFATHDHRLLEMITAIAQKYERPPHSYEFAFFLGRQEGLQERLLGDGERVRIYVPYGPQWFERLMGGLAEQSSSIGGALRSLLPG